MGSVLQELPSQLYSFVISAGSWGVIVNPCSCPSYTLLYPSTFAETKYCTVQFSGIWLESLGEVGRAIGQINVPLLGTSPSQSLVDSLTSSHEVKDTETSFNLSHP